jgi:polar amino acid transport system substrate-binding protein
VAAFNTLPMFDQVPGRPLAGIDGQLVQRLAQMECLELSVQLVQASSAIPAVQSGRADVAAGGWYATEERRKIVDLTPPYYADSVVFISRQGFDDTTELRGKVVGTVQGYLWPATLQQLYGEGNVRIYQTPDAQFNDLAEGRIDVVVEGLAAGITAVRNRPDAGLVVKRVQPDPAFPETVHPSVIALPHTKGNTSLAAALRDDIAELLRTGEIATFLRNAGVEPADAELPS